MRFLLLLAFPTLALAQIPTGTIGRGRVPGRIQRAPSIEIPKVVNAVNLVVQHRPELALTDSQFTAVLSIKRTLDSTNSPLMRRLDSVQHTFKNAPLFSEPTVGRRDSLAMARSLVGETVAEAEENITAARDKVFGLLTPSQVAKAEEIEEKARKAGEPSGRGRL